MKTSCIFIHSSINYKLHTTVLIGYIRLHYVFQLLCHCLFVKAWCFSPLCAVEIFGTLYPSVLTQLPVTSPLHMKKYSFKQPATLKLKSPTHFLSFSIISLKTFLILLLSFYYITWVADTSTFMSSVTENGLHFVLLLNMFEYRCKK